MQQGTSQPSTPRAVTAQASPRTPNADADRASPRNPGSGTPRTEEAVRRSARLAERAQRAQGSTPASPVRVLCIWSRRAAPQPEQVAPVAPVQHAEQAQPAAVDAAEPSVIIPRPRRRSRKQPHPERYSRSESPQRAPARVCVMRPADPEDMAPEFQRQCLQGIWHGAQAAWQEPARRGVPGDWRKYDMPVVRAPAPAPPSRSRSSTIDLCSSSAAASTAQSSDPSTEPSASAPGSSVDGPPDSPGVPRGMPDRGHGFVGRNRVRIARGIARYTLARIPLAQQSGSGTSTSESSGLSSGPSSGPARPWQLPPIDDSSSDEDMAIAAETLSSMGQSPTDEPSRSGSGPVRVCVIHPAPAPVPPPLPPPLWTNPLSREHRLLLWGAAQNLAHDLVNVAVLHEGLLRQREQLLECLRHGRAPRHGDLMPAAEELVHVADSCASIRHGQELLRGDLTQLCEGVHAHDLVLVNDGPRGQLMARCSYCRLECHYHCAAHACMYARIPNTPDFDHLRELHQEILRSQEPPEPVNWNEGGFDGPAAVLVMRPAPAAPARLPYSLKDMLTERWLQLRRGLNQVDELRQQMSEQVRQVFAFLSADSMPQAGEDMPGVAQSHHITRLMTSIRCGQDAFMRDAKRLCVESGVHDMVLSGFRGVTPGYEAECSHCGDVRYLWLDPAHETDIRIPDVPEFESERVNRRDHLRRHPPAVERPRGRPNPVGPVAPSSPSGSDAEPPRVLMMRTSSLAVPASLYPRVEELLREHMSLLDEAVGEAQMLRRMLSAQRDDLRVCTLDLGMIRPGVPFPGIHEVEMIYRVLDKLRGREQVYEAGMRAICAATIDHSFVLAHPIARRASSYTVRCSSCRFERLMSRPIASTLEIQIPDGPEFQMERELREAYVAAHPQSDLSDESDSPAHSTTACVMRAVLHGLPDPASPSPSTATDLSILRAFDLACRTRVASVNVGSSSAPCSPRTQSSGAPSPASSEAHPFKLAAHSQDQLAAVLGQQEALAQLRAERSPAPLSVAANHAPASDSEGDGSPFVHSPTSEAGVHGSLVRGGEQLVRSPDEFDEWDQADGSVHSPCFEAHHQHVHIGTHRVWHHQVHHA